MPFSSPLRGLSRAAAAAGAALLITAAPAAAYPSHTVQPGESLTSIAAANGMQVARLAAANGLSWDAQVIAGTTVHVPPADGLYTSTTGQTMGYSTSSAGQATPPPAPTGHASSSSSSGSSSTSSSSGSSSSSSSGSGGAGHYIQLGETLSAIAASLGVSPAALAAANGISNPNYILAGTTLKHPGVDAPASAPSATITPVRKQVSASTSSTGPEGNPAATGTGASPTNERLSSSEIASIAASHGIPGNLAAAIAWQESGNNNALTSSAGARGIMQVMPGTWDWINGSLAQPPLNPASARDNVRAGSLLLKQLLNESGGDEASAIAGYYQGLKSVRERGMYDDTKQYVANVQALKSRFGG